ncbi:MAG: HI1506-related protein [Negativicutes bacterium]|nr:HI1506-related protein [Negativicutes bacterium]
MPIKIISTKHGFRRCGVEHPATAAFYPDDRFTPEELARLKAEPLLIVEEVPDVSAVVEGDPLDSLTVAKLKEYAGEKQIDLGDAKTKPDILAAIKAASNNSGGE